VAGSGVLLTIAVFVVAVLNHVELLRLLVVVRRGIGCVWPHTTSGNLRGEGRGGDNRLSNQEVVYVVIVKFLWCNYKEKKLDFKGKGMHIYIIHCYHTEVVSGRKESTTVFFDTSFMLWSTAVTISSTNSNKHDPMHARTQWGGAGARLVCIMSVKLRSQKHSVSWCLEHLIILQVVKFKSVIRLRWCLCYPIQRLLQVTHANTCTYKSRISVWVSSGKYYPFPV